MTNKALGYVRLWWIMQYRTQEKNWPLNNGSRVEIRESSLNLYTARLDVNSYDLGEGNVRKNVKNLLTN